MSYNRCRVWTTQSSGSRIAITQAGRFLCAAVAFVGCMNLTGCVHRRMTIHSEPAGAQVLLEGKSIGYAPASADFTYYGTREVTLVKPGFETLTTYQKVRTPWYQISPLDFISDNLLPFRVTDRHDFYYKLQPSVVVPTKELLDRANRLRSEAHVGR